MRRSWAYVVMIVATLIGGSVLLLPLPPTVQIEEVAPSAGKSAAPARPESPPPPQPRAKAPARAAGQASTPPPQEPPAAVKRFPTQNTALKRLAPPPTPGTEAGGTRVLPPHPPTGWPPRPPAEHQK